MKKSFLGHVTFGEEVFVCDPFGAKDALYKIQIKPGKYNCYSLRNEKGNLIGIRIAMRSLFPRKMKKTHFLQLKSQVFGIYSADQNGDNSIGRHVSYWEDLSRIMNRSHAALIEFNRQYGIEHAICVKPTDEAKYADVYVGSELFKMIDTVEVRV